MKNKIKEVRLDMLVNHNSPYAVFEEVKHNFVYHYNIKEFLPLRDIFKDFIDLMEGRYPGYKRCNTKFHDIQHATDALLSISRLIDGYNIKNLQKKLSIKKVKLALIATIFHDIGYLQTIDDKIGTGAKYTFTHLDRTVKFLSKYFKKNKFSKQDFESAKNMVSCTGVEVNIKDIKFKNKEEKILGLMLATADLLGQMSSRTYLEKLIFLYFEFKEGGINKYSSEFDLLKKTLEFYKIVKELFEKEYCGVYRYAKEHFKKRYNIDENLYIKTIEREIRYLESIKSSSEISKKLRRKI